MGRLISAADVERVAAEGGATIDVGVGDVVTPLARDRAKELGVRVERAAGEAPSAGRGTDESLDPARAETAVRAALADAIQRFGADDIAVLVRETVRTLREGPDVPGPPSGLSADLSGRAALVTGAASGIGAAVAVALAAAGAAVLIGSFEGDPHDPDRTRAVIESAGGECRIVRADVTSTAEVDEACAEAVRAWGRLDIAVANAGVLRRDALPDLTDERWQQVLDVDLTGVMRTARAASRHIAGAGSIVCISSIAGGLFGWAEHAHYATAKAAVVGLGRSLAVELGPSGVRVNTVLPGLIETPQSADASASIGLEGLRSAAPRVPLQRIGSADEVAAAVLFLASDQSAYVTGQVLVVDGGLSAVLPV